MSTRDNKGRFSKKEEENYLKLVIPSIKTVLTLIFIVFIIMPWIIIISKFHPFDRIELLFERIMGINGAEESESPKKKWIILLNNLKYLG